MADSKKKHPARSPSNGIEMGEVERPRLVLDVGTVLFCPNPESEGDRMRIARHDAAGIVELSDGTKWRIWPGDLGTTLGWLPTTELDIAPSNSESCSHVLINVADNSEVRVIAAHEDWQPETIGRMLKADRT
jgi:hypothetical protein